MYWGGMILFFYSLMNLFKKSIFYIILGGIFLLLLIFEFVGDDIFKNMNLKNHLGEDVAFGVGFFLLVGIIVSIIGIALFRKYD